MNKTDITTLAKNFIRNSPANHIPKEAAIHQNCAGIKIFEAPIFALGAAGDELFAKYKSPDVIGPHFLCPVEWLATSKTVISFFLPYSGEIKTANAADCNWPAAEWLHGRYEGHNLLRQLTEYLIKTMSEAGFKSMAPSIDPRYKNGAENTRHTSNWSERHVAYACGLGTFGLSKGIITKKGMAGRFGSVVTELDLPKDTRPYSDIYEYCTMCGLCVDRCPANAISLENGKLSPLCSNFLDKTREKHNPRYGCGKCQVGVPCESGLPT